MDSILRDIPVVKVFIAGGSYAGLAAAVNLLDLGNGLSPRMAHDRYCHHPKVLRVNFEITIVDERDGFYHLIGSPLALADKAYAKKSWVKFEDIPALQDINVNFVQGSVFNVDCESKTARLLNTITKETTTHKYDYFVAATGLRRDWPVVPQSLYQREYIKEAELQICSLQNASSGVVIVGGGACGVEMAAELKIVNPDVKVTLVHSRDELLSSEPLPSECRSKTLEMVREAGVEVLMNHKVNNFMKVGSSTESVIYEVQFTNGKKMTASQVIMALSKSSSTATYLPPSALDSEGYVKILANMNIGPKVANSASHFCCGDIAKWSGIKRCGAAMHGGHFVAFNIHQNVLAQLTDHEPKFQELEEVPPMIGLAIGKNAVAYGPGTGVVSGPEVMQAYFRDDLGWQICWDYMQLGVGANICYRSGD